MLSGEDEDALQRMLETARRLSQGVMPMDLWLQTGRPPQVEWFTGCQRNVGSTPVSDEAMRGWIRLIFGDEFGTESTRKFTDQSGTCWLVGAGHGRLQGRADWADTEQPVLRFRLIS